MNSSLTIKITIGHGSPSVTIINQHIEHHHQPQIMVDARFTIKSNHNQSPSTSIRCFHSRPRCGPPWAPELELVSALRRNPGARELRSGYDWNVLEPSGDISDEGCLNG